jgi:uncharacterized protein (TIGR00369 family)
MEQLTLLESAAMSNSGAVPAGGLGVPLVDRARAIIDGTAPMPPIARLIGFRIVEIEPGRAVVDLDIDLAKHANPMGTVHGGVLCDVADAAMGFAYASTLARDESFATLELKINFLRPVWRTRLRATGHLVQRGRTVGMVECDVVDAQGRLVARASSTCMTLRDEQAAGR